MEKKLTEEELKINLANQIIDLIGYFKTETEIKPKHIGNLNTAQGYVGFEKAEVGTAVYELNDRYIVYFKLIDKNLTLERRYYKETLKPIIDFI